MTMEPELVSRYAPAHRKLGHELDADITAVQDSPVVDSILTGFGGLVAVLNRERQILALNHALLDALGVQDPETALGLRLGEALGCTHCRDNAGGCGCSEFCASCGAAIAMVTCLTEGTAQQRECLVTVDRDGRTEDLVFQVRVAPLVGGHLLVYLQDQTLPRRQSELANAFFHDVNNLVQAIQGASELLPGSDPDEMVELGERILRLVSRLGREILVQRTLLEGDTGHLAVQWEHLPVDQVLREVEDIYRDHPLTRDRELARREAPTVWRVRSDRALLVRILANMVTNALEATEPGGLVRLWAERTGTHVRICVHNVLPLSARVSQRVFQRHFSTKGGRGRGLGTHAMRLFGERYLGGKVDFETGPGRGTTFRLTLPLETGWH